MRINRNGFPAMTLALTLLACGGSDTVAPPDDPTFPKTFSVSGNQIVDAQGTETLFRGFDPQDPVWQALCGDSDMMPWQELQFQKMSEWGANVVRLSIHPGSWKLFGPTRSFEVMDQFVAWSKKHNLYVYVDFHGIGFPPTEQYPAVTDDCFSAIGNDANQTTQNDILEFWQAVANRYKDNAVVSFYELFNEPDHNATAGGMADWILWRDYVETLIDKIRELDPNKPVIVGGLQFAYDLSFASNNPVRRDQVIYATHPYSDSDWNQSWTEAFGNLRTQYPIFATEFGFQNNPPRRPESECTRCTGLYRNELMSFLETNKISWTVWSFSDTWFPTLLTDKNYTPSESGLFFKSLILNSQ